MIRRLLPLLVLGACGDPPPVTLTYALTTGPSQVCHTPLGIETHSCAEVAMLCDAVLSIRVVPPAEPNAPYISVCERVIGRPNLCSIAGIDLPPPAMPVSEQTLEIQVAVYADHLLEHDENTGDPICPTDITYAPDGLPLEAVPTPAVGGRTFYHPGDAETVVTLGCTDATELVDPACSGANNIMVTATVDDFDNGFPVTKSIADRLSLSIGEPKAVDTTYQLNPPEVAALERTVPDPPSWGANIDKVFASSACVQVLEDATLVTNALTCRPVQLGATRIDITGVRLARTTLTQIVTALGETQFPDTGLVIGMVRDELGNPEPGVSIAASLGDVQYLSADRLSFGGTQTSDSGIFVSRNAPYGTTFFPTGTSLAAKIAFGGLVEGKVTIVVVQLEPQSVGN